MSLSRSFPIFFLLPSLARSGIMRSLIKVIKAFN